MSVYTGVVSCFYADKHYGFIKSRGFPRDVFVLESVLRDARAGVGASVYFTVAGNNKVCNLWVLKDKGPCATRRFSGIVKSIYQRKQYGFIDCIELRNMYGKDTFVLQSQLDSFERGDAVTFNAKLNDAGEPQAIGLQHVFAGVMTWPIGASSITGLQFSGQDIGVSMQAQTVRTMGRYPERLSHSDVIIVPELFCAEGDIDIFHKLQQEIQWTPRLAGSHFRGNPEASDTYRRIVESMCNYFDIEFRTAHVNFYPTDAHMRPYHHDAYKYNESLQENMTLIASFGSGRDLTFRHARTGETKRFLLRNGMAFYFGRDINDKWLHGIDALADTEQRRTHGRISISLWGICRLIHTST